MDDLQCLVEEVFFLGTFYGPPDRLDVAIFVSQVRVVPVHPDPEVSQNLCLSLDVFFGEFLAVGDESVYSNDILYVLFRS